MIDMDICVDIDLVYNETLNEIREHYIVNKLARLRRKKEKTDNDKKRLAEYERYYRAFKAIKDARDQYCFLKHQETNRKDLLLLQSIWKEEISKWHVGWLPRYKNVLISMGRILRQIK
jgi:hypothetical protein